MKIIYPNEGGIAVIHPTAALPIEEIARKDVPFGRPFLVVEDEAVPEDRAFRGAWEADFSEPDGHGLGAQRWFIAQGQAGLLEITARVAPVAPEAVEVPPLEAPDFDDMEWPPEMAELGEDIKRASYDAWIAQAQTEHAVLTAQVQAHNEQQARSHDLQIAAWEGRKQSDTERCNALIAQMKAEVFAIEGVTL